MFDECETAEEAIYQALGAASVAWDSHGLFQSERVNLIGEALIARLVEFGL